MNARDGKLNILVVDESVVNRRVLVEALAAMPEVGNAAATPNQRLALSRLGLQTVDALLVDMSASAQEGLECIRAVREQFPEVAVMAICQLETTPASLVIAMLEAGALEVVAKPSDRSNAAELGKFRQQLEGVFRGIRGRREAGRARRLSAGGRQVKPVPLAPIAPATTVRPAPAPPPSREAPEPRPRPTSAPRNLELLAIGVSTGGPNALKSVIPLLPGDLGVPVLLVQHMPATFTKALAESLDRGSALRVKEAEEGEPLLPGGVYVAPGGRHMAVRPEGHGNSEHLLIAINDDPPVNSCRPAVDVLLKSLAQTGVGRVLAVIMTGMGSDGMAGVEAIKKKGGYCLSQSEESCVVYGMPRAVDEAGLSDERVPLESLAERIVALLRRGQEQRERS